MRIVTVNCGLLRGNGIDTAISTTLRRIHEINSDVRLELICGEVDGMIEDGFPKDIPIQVKQVKSICGFRHPLTFTLLKYVNGSDDTIIHYHHPIVTLPLLFRKEKKVVTWHGNNNLNWNDIGFGPWPRRITRKIILDICTHMFRGLDRIVTISDYLRNELINRYGISGKRVERVYWGIDTNRFCESGKDEGFMLFVGRHVRYKGIDKLIGLAKELNFPLTCVGSGIEMDSLQDYAKRIGAPVEFKGVIPLSELIGLYQQCSFYVTASRWEGFGLPVIEAGACEKTAIVPKNTAHVELVEDSKTGLLYDDMHELRMAARSLIEEPQKRRDMGKAAREYVTKKFNLDETAMAYLDIYNGLVRG